MQTAKQRLALMVDELQLRRRSLWSAPSDIARERIKSAIIMLSVDIRKAQAEYWLQGVNVYISYDRNGMPMRVTDSREDIVS